MNMRTHSRFVSKGLTHDLVVRAPSDTIAATYYVLQDCCNLAIRIISSNILDQQERYFVCGMATYL